MSANICSIPETAIVCSGEGQQMVNFDSYFLSDDSLVERLPCKRSLLQPPLLQPTPNMSRANSFQYFGFAQHGTAMDPSFSANLITKLNVAREQQAVPAALQLNMPSQVPQPEFIEMFKCPPFFCCTKAHADENQAMMRLKSDENNVYPHLSRTGIDEELYVEQLMEDSDAE
mmetsp:Transcript_31488/g.61838  ORF Transcript_31488/g.61838 Transcript_31488/m.61838 type:complete len:172 (+) Transcript_31488:113-628(+)